MAIDGILYGLSFPFPFGKIELRKKKEKRKRKMSRYAAFLVDFLEFDIVCFYELQELYWVRRIVSEIE